MLILIQLLILIGCFVVPNDSMKGFYKKLHHSSTNDQKTTKFLLQIVKEMSSEREGIYKLVKLFTGVENAEKDEKYFTIPAEKAKEFLKKVFLAIKNNAIMLEKKEIDEKWICAEKQPKNLLKPILEELFERKLKLDKYSDNYTLLMILSVAIRICAIFGSEKNQYSLEAFLTAYKCANIGEKNQQPMIYSYKIIEGPTLTFSYMKMLPIYKENNELSLHMSDEIAEIKIYKTPTSSADQNFDFLLKLSAVDLTPFSIVHFAQQIHCSIKQGTARLEYDNVKLSQLAIVHFTGESLTYHKKEYFPGCSFRPKVDAFCIIHLSNFMVNLLNGILNSPNLNNYFVHTGLSVELWAEQVFFSDLFKTYNDGQCVEFNRKKKLIVEREEHYLHFEDAFHINWNPYKEMFKLIQVLKYQCFCSTELYSLGFNEGFENGLRNECEEMRKNDELDGKRPNLGTDTITNDEQNMRLTPLKTLENFEQIKKAYEKLKMFLNEKRYGKCNKKEEKEDGYNAIVKLNEEFGKAFEKVLMKF